MRLWPNIRRRHRKRQRSRFFRYSVNLLRIMMLLLIIDIFYISTIWPDWSDFGRGSVKKTQFIKAYEQRLKLNPELPPLYWKPVTLNRIPVDMRHAVIVAEDSRFYQHTGFDLDALAKAMQYNIEHLHFKYGGSTISQQTIKNMFLTSNRTPLRKWHELILTIGMEIKLNKQRILEIYLNVAEFGKGIFGVEAAAQYYYGRPAIMLNKKQMAELAASLPSPKKHNPQTRTTQFVKRSNKIFRFMSIYTKNKTY